MQAAINSPGHRRTVLNPNAYFIGVGIDGPTVLKMCSPRGGDLLIPGQAPPFTHPFTAG